MTQAREDVSERHGTGAREVAPYKIVPYEEGDGAEVIDRATGHHVGYVLRANVGWQAYLSSAAGWPLPFEWCDYTEDESDRAQRVNEVLGWRWVPMLSTHYRANAAERVWIAHTEGR